jgi:hypothetical protein
VVGFICRRSVGLDASLQGRDSSGGTRRRAPSPMMTCARSCQVRQKFTHEVIAKRHLDNHHHTTTSCLQVNTAACRIHCAIGADFEDGSTADSLQHGRRLEGLNRRRASKAQGMYSLPDTLLTPKLTQFGRAACVSLKRLNAMSACYSPPQMTPRKSAPAWWTSTSSVWRATASRYEQSTLRRTSKRAKG